MVLVLHLVLQPTGGVFHLASAACTAGGWPSGLPAAHEQLCDAEG